MVRRRRSHCVACSRRFQSSGASALVRRECPLSADSVELSARGCFSDKHYRMRFPQDSQCQRPYLGRAINPIINTALTYRNAPSKKSVRFREWRIPVNRMMQPYPQIGPSRLSGDEDEWRVLIRWRQEAPTAMYTISEALREAERLRQADEHETARRILEAAECVPMQ